MVDVRQIYVLGLDDFHLAQLEHLERAGDYSFHELYRRDDVKSGRTDVVSEVLAGAPAILARASPPAAAVVGYWDFPVSTMLPVLRRRLGHVTPTLEAVLRCEHKYWSRLEQVRSVPEAVPDFVEVDPFAPDVVTRIDIEPPYWIKPVKSVLSHLGFRVDDISDLEHAITEIRRGIDRIAIPFDHLLALAELPPEIDRVDGRHCIVESLISQGRQCTLEGYAYGDEVVVYGAVDSVREGRHRSSFSRYQYPSTLPPDVIDRMTDLTRRFVTHIGLTDSPFNIEFFWDEPSDQIWLLEVNPRISKSHAPLLKAVDGEYHHQVMLDLALGQRPDPPHRAGRHRVAAKFMWRCDRDAVVRRMPHHERIDAALSSMPFTEVEFHVTEGRRLSEMAFQDSYTYELASIFVSADDEGQLLERYDECRTALDRELELDEI